VERWGTSFGLVPISRIPGLEKLRHFYAKGALDAKPMMFPRIARNSPLETHYYDMSSALCVTSVLTAWLESATLRFRERHTAAKDAVTLVENCKLRVLDLFVHGCEDAVLSPTLTLLDIRILHWTPLSGYGIVGHLPNLLHLRLTVSDIQDGVMLPRLPSLRSLSIMITEGCVRAPHLKHLLQSTQQLVAADP